MLRGVSHPFKLPKNRVESICARLNDQYRLLVGEGASRSPWMRPIASNLNAGSIKTAVIGLGPVDLGRSHFLPKVGVTNFLI